MTALSVSGLSVSLSDKQVLTALDFQVPVGSWLGILGPNGSGKTTLIRAVAGMIPFEGQVDLMDRPVQNWSARERAKEVALVSQTVPMYFDFRVADLVLLGRAPHKNWLSPYNAADRKVAQAALAEVDLCGFEDRSVLTLSGGEQRRVLLAQALAQEARLLVLDEPTSHLDVHHQYEFMDHVRSLVDSGRTAIAVFHDLELAGRYADHLLVLENGRKAAEGIPSDVLTSEVIKRVFRMSAEVRTENGLRIDFSSPS
ncbi:MAG: iron complex transport system ATP-binding protein [Rhodothermales bacterium]